MNGPAAKTRDYYDYDEREPIACPHCHWTGSAGEGSHEYYRELFDVSCPSYDKMLLIVGYRTIEETKAAAGNPKALADMGQVESGLPIRVYKLEGAIDELKTHQRGPRVVLRSKHPDGVLQEAYGYLCTHYAIRRLMHDAALKADLDPDRLSFIRGLRAARRSTRSRPGFSPHRLAGV